MGSRSVAGGCDQLQIPARRRYPDELLAQAAAEEASRLLHVPGRASDRHDPRPIRSPGGLPVVAGDAGQPLRRPAAVGARTVDVAALRVRPGNEGDRGPVRRPGGMELADLEVREPDGLAVRIVHHPEMIQGDEREPVTRGRGNGVSNLLQRERRRVLDAVLESDGGAERQLDVDPEGDLGRLGAVDRHPPDPSAVGDDDGAGVGREGVARKDVEAGRRLLVVALHRVGEPPLLTRFRVPDAQPRVNVQPAPVDQPPAVGGDRRAEGRAVAR